MVQVECGHSRGTLPQLATEHSLSQNGINFLRETLMLL